MPSDPRASLNIELLYQMMIASDEGLHQLAVHILEGFFPELAKRIRATPQADEQIIGWFCELGFDRKRAGVLYAYYKLRKFNKL